MDAFLWENGADGATNLLVPEQVGIPTRASHEARGKKSDALEMCLHTVRARILSEMPSLLPALIVLGVEEPAGKLVDDQLEVVCRSRRRGGQRPGWG
jgi:hypothetical protein